VVRAGAVDGLRALAAKAACGVVNTWGAKGVFRWDSPHHFGTAGLQADDFALAGFDDAQIVIATGIDPLESPPERWAFGQVLDVEPAQLATLVDHWSPPTADVPPYPALYRELSAALADLYADGTSVPRNPARAAAELGALRPVGALVAVDPGPAGLWMARTFPTTETGSVIVPSRAVRGFAAAAGVVSSLDGRPSVSVISGDVDEATQAVIDLANRWGAQLVVEVWGDDDDGSDRGEVLRDALESRATVVSRVGVDFSSTSVLTDVAGPVVAWTS
jgi:thiamine pyrophosphate-dependent acetolactate synthase large subunit-like protein